MCFFCCILTKTIPPPRAASRARRTAAWCRARRAAAACTSRPPTAGAPTTPPGGNKRALVLFNVVFYCTLSDYLKTFLYPCEASSDAGVQNVTVKKIYCTLTKTNAALKKKNNKTNSLL